MLKFSSDFNPKKWAAGLQKQVKFAQSRALTATAKAVQVASEAELPKHLDKPTPFTRKGLWVRGAHSSRLFAEVGYKDIQAKYLLYQFQGGERRPTRKALRLPSKVDLDTYGNLKRGQLTKLVTQARRKGSHLFYGKPSAGLPAGVWRRVGNTLEPVVVMPQQSAKYRKRFDWWSFAHKVAAREFPREFEKAFADAMRTAK